MARVYIETSIPSFYFETRSEPRLSGWRASTRLWWDQYRSGFELVTSEVVVRELGEAPPEKRDAMLSLLESIPRLPQVDGLREVAEYYIAHRLLPSEALADARFTLP